MQMLRLARLTGEYQLEEKLQQLFDANARQLVQYPEGHAFLLQTYLMTQMGMKEVIILKSKRGEDVQPLMQEIQKEFHPEITFLVSNDHGRLAQLAPFTKDYHPIENKTTVYVCENFICSKPTTNMDEAIELILKKK